METQASISKPLLIVVGATILLAGMRFAASFLTPVLLACFFATLLFPIFRLLKRRIPSGLALLLTLGVFLLIAVFLAWLIGTSLTTMAADLESSQDQFSQRQAELSTQLGKLSRSAGVEQAVSALDPAKMSEALGFVVGAVASLFKSGLLILLVTMFVLAESTMFRSRMLRAFGADHYLPKNMISLARMMISYFGLRAIVNLFTALGTGLMLWLFGIPNSALWAVLIFFLAFIPYIGSFFAMIPPVLLAYAQSGLGVAIVIIILAVVINGVAENLVAPLVMGKGLSISPTVVFLSFIFWMFILGGSGAFIAMPLTVAIILFLGSFVETSSFSKMLVLLPEPEPKD